MEHRKIEVMSNPEMEVQKECGEDDGCVAPVNQGRLVFRLWVETAKFRQHVLLDTERESEVPASPRYRESAVEDVVV